METWTHLTFTLLSEKPSDTTIISPDTLWHLSQFKLQYSFQWFVSLLFRRLEPRLVGERKRLTRSLQPKSQSLPSISDLFYLLLLGSASTANCPRQPVKCTNDWIHPVVSACKFRHFHDFITTLQGSESLRAVIGVSELWGPQPARSCCRASYCKL